ncbi:MAG: hypothetical protein U0163_09300 [Gemmatimonadaceae bacterium]
MRADTLTRIWPTPRAARTRPWFAAAIVTTLALSIGANAAMFGIVDRLLFRPPPLLKDNPKTVHRVCVSETYRGKERAGEVSQYARYPEHQALDDVFLARSRYTARKMAVGQGDDARELRTFRRRRVRRSSRSSTRRRRSVAFTTAEDRPPVGTPVVVVGEAGFVADAVRWATRRPW